MIRATALGLVPIFCALAAWAQPRESIPALADTIYFNGVVETLDADFHRAEAVAITGKKIVAVGSSEQIIADHQRRGTRLVDLGGRTLMPGFVDAHTHFFNDFPSAGMTLDEIQAFVLSRGVTTLGNPTVGPLVLRTLQDFAATGRMVVRTSLYLAYNNPCGEVRGEWYLDLQPSTDPDQVLRVPGVKIFDDGGACNNLATTFPWLDPTTGLWTFGELYFDETTLAPIVANAHAAGWQVLIHSLGDRSNPVAMAAIADALGGQPNRRRHRIDHNTLVHADQIAFYRQVGIVPVVFPGIGTCAVNHGTSPYSYLPVDDRSWAAPNRTMLANGLPIAWHGDWCCGSSLDRYNPFRSLFGFVTRKGIDADGSICEPPDWVAAEAITVDQALRAMTLSSAYALGMDRFVGSLEPGKFADLIVLSDDPRQIASDNLKEMTVLSTVIGGAPRYCAAGSEALCQP